MEERDTIERLTNTLSGVQPNKKIYIKWIPLYQDWMTADATEEHMQFRAKIQERVAEIYRQTLEVSVTSSVYDVLAKEGGAFKDKVERSGCKLHYAMSKGSSFC